MSTTVCRSPEPEPEDPPRGEDQAGECGTQGGSHCTQGPAPQVGCFSLLNLEKNKLPYILVF